MIIPTSLYSEWGTNIIHFVNINLIEQPSSHLHQWSWSMIQIRRLDMLLKTVAALTLPSPPNTLPLKPRSLGVQGVSGWQKQTRRTRWKVMNSPSYVKKMSIELSWEEKSNIEIAAMLYICTSSPWPTGDSKYRLIVECSTRQICMQCSLELKLRIHV